MEITMNGTVGIDFFLTDDTVKAETKLFEHFATADVIIGKNTKLTFFVENKEEADEIVDGFNNYARIRENREKTRKSGREHGNNNVEVEA